MEWGCALSGEVGELCNFLKKMSRGDKIPKKYLAHEIADIHTYLSLLADNLDIDTEDAIIEKFNIVSKRWGSKFRL
jgi:NTP pyrophosphatase (non-canonical NTP hydrolase)